MKTIAMFLILISSSLFAGVEEDKAALIKIHEEARRAHFETNAELLARYQADRMHSVNHGAISTPTKEETQKFFTEYFQGARYTEWDDLEPPVIRISDDGSMAWMINRVKVKRTQKVNGKDTQIEFVCAWMSAYEKQKGEWKLVANASTFEPQKK